VEGVTNTDSWQRMDILEEKVREDLKEVSVNRMVVLDPLPVEIFTFEADSDDCECVNHPEKKELVTRSVKISKEIYIERDDLQEDAGEDFYRFSKVGGEVFLRFAYCIKLEEIVKDADGNVVSLRCSHDPASKGNKPKHVKGVIHWVNKSDCVDAEVRLINALFLDMPEDVKGDGFLEYVNPQSMVVKKGKAEPSLSACSLTDRFQFERKGFFAPDTESKPEKLIFNCAVNLKESSDEKNRKGANTASRKEEQAKQAAEKEVERLANQAQVTDLELHSNKEQIHKYLEMIEDLTNQLVQVDEVKQDEIMEYKKEITENN